MQRIVFCAAVVAATALHAQEVRMPFTNLPVTGPHDVTAAMTRLGDKAAPTPCALPGQSRWSPAGAKYPAQVFYRLCNAEETRAWYERWARSVRSIFGDPGRH
jgi:hypothetical protein